MFIKRTKVGGKSSSIPDNVVDDFKTSLQHSNFLHIYFFFAYYMLLSPFRFQKVAQGLYKVHRWVPQQVLCGISTFLCIVHQIATLRSSFTTMKDGDPVSYFGLFSAAIGFIYKLTVFNLLWRKRFAFEKVINFLNSQYLVPYNLYQVESFKVIGTFCGTYAVLSFIQMTFRLTISDYSDWSPEWIYRGLVAEARYTFFVTSVPPTNIVPVYSEITNLDAVLAILQALSMQSRYITGLFMNLCIVMHVLTLWAPTSAFTQNLYLQIMHEISKSDCEQVHLCSTQQISSVLQLELYVMLKRYETLKSLSILIGEAIGTAIFPYIGEALFDYAITLDSVLTTPDVLQRTVLLFYYVAAFCILIFSAEIVQKMNWFRLWVADNRRISLIGQNKLEVIFDDLEHQSVGITASGVFTINYSFVGTIITLLITYFIIQLQSEVKAIERMGTALA